MIQRLLTILPDNSFLLFGARGTGKTSFLQQHFKDRQALWIDLLDPLQEERFLRSPNDLWQILESKHRPAWVVIDEVQKVPSLLNVVHRSIESHGVQFALTGSSARKLKRGSANLLAGRAFVYNMFPFTHRELGNLFNLSHALQWGTLPGLQRHATDEHRKQFLQSYGLSYLKEEIWAEHLIRQLDPFRRFLEVAAQCGGEIINYNNIAKDVGVDHKTVQAYFSILEDTLVGFHLPSYHASVRKQQLKNSKFFFFDIGVQRALAHALVGDVRPGTSDYGKYFEQWVIQETYRLNEYQKKDYHLSYICTAQGSEIDLVIERPGMPLALVEIKSKTRVDERDVKTLESYLDEFKNAEAYCFSQDPYTKKIGRVTALPWEKGLVEIGL